MEVQKEATNKAHTRLNQGFLWAKTKSKQNADRDIDPQ